MSLLKMFFRISEDRPFCLFRSRHFRSRHYLFSGWPDLLSFLYNCVFNVSLGPLFLSFFHGVLSSIFHIPSMMWTFFTNNSVTVNSCRDMFVRGTWLFLPVPKISSLGLRMFRYYNVSFSLSTIICYEMGTYVKICHIYFFFNSDEYTN